MADQVEGKVPPKPDDILDPVEYARFIGLVKNSRDKLVKWWQMRKKVGKKGLLGLFTGGAENIILLLTFLRVVCILFFALGLGMCL